MKTIPQYCQKCREQNTLGEQSCRRCGTRLMLVVFPQSLKYDTNYVPTYYEDHLLERVTSLELRLSQITERLAATLDLMLRQTKTAHTDHVLLETLIESLNTLGTIEKDKLAQSLRERIASDDVKDTEQSRREKLTAQILANHQEPQADLFAHLIKEGIKLFSQQEERQALRTLERALLISPKNVPLLAFVAETFFRADKFELAKSYLEKARGHAPQNAKILLLLAVISADGGNTVIARKLLKVPSKQKSAAFCTNYISGMLAALENKWNDALVSFKETLAARNAPETNYLAACAYFQLKRYKMALRHLQKAVETDAGFADAWYMLSVIYELLNDIEKAGEALELAWVSKETGAQCLEFLKRRNPENSVTALPFLRLKHLKNRLLTSGSMRLTNLFREELFKVLN